MYIAFLPRWQLVDPVHAVAASVYMSPHGDSSAFQFRRRSKWGALPLIMTVLSSAVCLAMAALLAWHVYLLTAGQGTLDVMAASRNAAALVAGERVRDL
jgi:hypothetical protein